MDLKFFVLGEVNPDVYYKKRFPKWDSRSRPNVSCVWHEDKSPSLSLSLKGGGAKCHAANSCAKSIGNIVHFEAEMYKISEPDAALKIYSEFVRATIKEEELATLQLCLQKDRTFKKWMAEDCGLDEHVIKVFGLGLDQRMKRVIIPVRDRWGNIVNFRKYRMPRHRKTKQDDSMKVINHTEGEGEGKISYGHLDLFPWDKFVNYTLDKPIFVMASEKETMLAIRDGLQAICSTNGEASWDEEWTQLLLGYDICVVGQTDDAGRNAASKRFATLQSVCNSIVNLVLPTRLKDYADWVVREGGNGIKLLAEYKKQLESGGIAPPIKSKSDEPFLSENSEFPAVPGYYTEEYIDLAAICSKPEIINKRIKTKGIVAAKSTHNYTIPWKFSVKEKGKPERVYSMPIGREMISFLKASDGMIKEVVGDMIGNDKVTIAPLAHINVTEVEVIPMVAIDCDSPYVVQRCLYVGEWIESNVPYELEIIATNEVQTQKTIGIITKITPISLSFEGRKFSDDELASLQIFQSKEKTVWEKMIEVAEVLCESYTKILNREDWHLIALLTWISPIGWKFPHESETQRGWLNSLALGDTQTGKSKVVETLQRITKCGQVVNAENCTYVGLVGGAIKMGSGQLMLRWGRIPLGDKQLVVLEELSGLSVEEISNMSDVRSSGVARLDKGGLSSQTNARTRILALSNVRPVNRTLASYTSGVKAVQELIGHGEDIARFDLIGTLVDSDVSVELINQPFKESRKHQRIEEIDFQRLVQFAWALKPEQIKFTTEAYYACLEGTQELSVKYHSSVPLFKGGSGRYKIARIAAAIATLQFAWDGTNIVINEDHVAAAVKFMQLLYDKYPLKYDEWSRQIFDREKVKDEEDLDDSLRGKIRNIKKLHATVETIIHMGKFTRDELCSIASMQIVQADDLIGVWVRGRVLRKGDANVWEITPDGKRWLEKFLNHE